MCSPDQGSTYSGDLESEAVSTPHSWEDELNHYTLRSNNLQDPDPDIRQVSRVGVEQDLELDFPTGWTIYQYYHPVRNAGMNVSALSVTLIYRSYKSEHVISLDNVTFVVLVF